MFSIHIFRTWWLLLKNLFKNFMEPYHEKHSCNTWSILQNHTPQKYSLRSSKQLLVLHFGGSRIFLTVPEIYSKISKLHVLFYLFVRGSNKQQRRRGIIFNFTKGAHFFISCNNQLFFGLISQYSPSSCTLQEKTSLLFSPARKKIYLDTHWKKELTDLF